MKRYNELDVFRFLAAFFVLLYHYTADSVAVLLGASDGGMGLGSVFKYGYLGVDLFFMISGFVILASALNRGASDFVVSRATRLYPLYWVCVSLTAIVIFLLGEGQYSVGAAQYLANLTMVNDYFGVADVDGVYWTLQVELKFYACVFVLILFGWLPYVRYWLSAWLLMTLSYSLWQQPFFMPWLINPSYSPYFIAGAAFFMVRREGWSIFYGVVLLVAWWLALLHVPDQVPQFIVGAGEVDVWVVQMCVSVFFLVFSLMTVPAIKVPYSPVWFMLGGLTYPLYLLHNRIGKILFAHLGDSLPPWLSLFLVTVLMLLLSWSLYRFVERSLSLALKEALLRRVLCKL